MNRLAEKLIPLESTDLILSVFGSYDENIHIIEKKFGVSVIVRGDFVKITGEADNINAASKTVSALIEMAKNGETITEQTVSYLSSISKDDDIEKAKELHSSCVCITSNGRPIKPKTLGQKQYIDAIQNNTVVFGVGPAGTGKTYLAVAMAVRAFRAQEISRIILTRPAVEAGEKLGFLPGDLQTKVDPYLRPLYDAMFDMFGSDAFAKHQERGVIEVAPLAYMRGRTLDDAFIILDEAQNTTHEQMKMFLTRIGNNSKAVVTGDITQIDLPDPKKSGLIDAVKVLENVEDIKTVWLNDTDVVRNRIVKLIINAYAKFDSKEGFENHGKSKSIDNK